MTVKLLGFYGRVHHHRYVSTFNILGLLGNIVTGFRYILLEKSLFEETFIFQHFCEHKCDGLDHGKLVGKTP